MPPSASGTVVWSPPSLISKDCIDLEQLLLTWTRRDTDAVVVVVVVVVVIGVQRVREVVVVIEVVAVMTGL